MNPHHIVFHTSNKTTVQRTEHVTERFELRTAEADAAEAEELQHALNQPADGGGAVGDDDASETATKGLDYFYSLCLIIQIWVSPYKPIGPARGGGGGGANGSSILTC